jgi:tetratricopeptide (TPR) repeat protein
MYLAANWATPIVLSVSYLDRKVTMSLLLRLRRRRSVFALGTLLAVATLTQAQAAQPQSTPSQGEPQATPSQPGSKENPERQHALDVYHAGRFVEAMPMLEKLAADDPSDIVVKEAWAFSVMAYADTLPDADLRKKARVRARAIAVDAKKLGDNSGLLQSVLALPEDGSDPEFSDRKEVDDAMKAAEADFSRGDLDKARDGYLRAFVLDPKNYAAALFIGDVYFKQHENGSAGEWFARAIQIDPDRETAYRYWGDALWAMGKSAEAREKYIQAIVAEPYNQRSLMGLNQWSQRAKMPLNWVRLQDKSSVAQKDDQHINITLDPTSLGKNDPAASAWLIYGMERALWRQEKFKKEFPNEQKYRRTMREETNCLHLMVTTMTEQKDFDKNQKNLDPALQQLVKVDRAGFLEPFALLNRGDNDIAQDYVPYRVTHRDIIYRYFDEFVVPKVGDQPTAK